MTDFKEHQMEFAKKMMNINPNEDISVFWHSDWMYVEDESNNQAIATAISLFNAYQFAVYIQAPIFDYDATDKEVEEFHNQLLTLINEDFYTIDVWKYIDDIADDFKKLTNIELGIDDKRGIIANITDSEDYGVLQCFGTHSCLAKMLWECIKGTDRYYITDKNGNKIHPQGCNNPIINQLADKYLQADDYDIIKFAEELHKVTEYEIPKDFGHFMDIAYGITETCYFMGTSLLAENKEFNLKFIVGEINWQGDWIKPIYCCMNSTTKDIWFEANGVRSAFIYDMIIPHYMCGCDFDEIEVKLTNKNLIALMEQYELTQDGVIDGYIHCNMYGTQAKLQSFV